MVHRLILLLLLGSSAACGAAPLHGAAPTSRSSGERPVSRSAVIDRCLQEAAPVEVNFDERPSRVTVRHILIKHADLQRPAEGVTRSRGEACLRARKALEALKGGAEFEAVVRDYSDERGATTRAGSLGEVQPGDLDPAFAAAAFALDIQQVSFVVESRAGFHIILRTR